MAYSKKTFGDLKQSLADRHDSGVLPTDTATLNYWARLLNRAKDYCVDYLEITEGVSVTTTNATAALATAFISPSVILNSDDQEVGLISQEQSGNASGPMCWITGDWDSGFTFNVPTGMDDTYTIYAKSEYEDMDADADVCPIDDAEAVVAHAYSMLRKAETDPLDDADEAMAECRRRLDTIKGQMSQRDGGQRLTLPTNA